MAASQQAPARALGAVPYVDIASQHRTIKDELLAAVSEVLDGGQFILGPQVAEFEERFAELCGVRYALGVNSGTDALILALRALGIGPGDEVISAPNSFVASAACIQLVGAKTVFVDVADDYNIDPSKIEAAITPRTKAILPVHLTGRPCRMDEVMSIAKARGLSVVEDCAQAVLAECNGAKVGSFGDVGGFSLHPLKTLNACGDGGMITTDDSSLYESMKVMRNLGLKTRDDCTVWSSNSRLDTLQAAMLLVKLKYLESWTEARRANAELYRERLRGVTGVVLPPPDRPGEKSVFHTFVVRAQRREELRAHLAAKGIGSNVHYPVPIHLSNAGRELGYSRGSFPVAEAQAAEICSLPVYPELAAGAIDRICDEVTSFYANS